MHAIIEAPDSAIATPWLKTAGAAQVPAPMRSVQVGIGELKIGGRSDRLQALLGSCVGIAFIWEKRNRCGLAHCLLPEAPGQQAGMSARYVSQAVPALLRLIGACEADYADICVVVAGGANMLNACSSRFQIGRQNADAAEKYLRQRGLDIQYCHVGGQCGRTIVVDGGNHSYMVNDIVQTTRNTAHA
jgi:chemotaxis protein CheD